jgi:hypothetical protein
MDCPEVVAMAVIVLLVMVLLLYACTATRRWWGGRYRDDPASPGTGALAGDGGVPAAGEARLVVGLLAGELSPTHYREAMARIAIEDDLLHPLAVPPETLGREA